MPDNSWWVQEFEVNYSDVLEQLKKMPNSTAEEKYKRWEWFRSCPGYDDMVITVLKDHRPGTYEKLIKQKTDTNVPDNFYLIFIETIKAAVETYTGTTKSGNSYSFSQCIGQLYKQIALQEAEKDGGNWIAPTDIPAKKKYKVYKLIRKMDELREKERRMDLTADLVQKAIDVLKIDYSAKEKAAAVKVWEINKGLSSIDAPINEDGTPLVDIIKNENTDFEAIENQGAFKSGLEKLICIISDWETVESTVRKLNRDWIRVFLTKEILIALKLKYLNELTIAEQKSWGNQKAEIHCGQWCPQRKSCTVKKEKQGCYARYTSEPAGEEDVYNLLEPFGTVIYKKILHKAYVDRSIVDEPQDFYEVYEKLLRNDFDFSDKIIGTVLKKDKSTISQNRKVFENKTRPALYKMCLIV